MVLGYGDSMTEGENTRYANDKLDEIDDMFNHDDGDGGLGRRRWSPGRFGSQRRFHISRAK